MSFFLSRSLKGFLVPYFLSFFLLHLLCLVWIVGEKSLFFLFPSSALRLGLLLSSFLCARKEPFFFLSSRPSHPVFPFLFALSSFKSCPFLLGRDASSSVFEEAFLCPFRTGKGCRLSPVRAFSSVCSIRRSAANTRLRHACFDQRNRSLASAPEVRTPRVFYHTRLVSALHKRLPSYTGPSNSRGGSPHQ